MFETDACLCAERLGEFNGDFRGRKAEGFGLLIGIGEADFLTPAMRIAAKHMGQGWPLA